MSHVLKNPSLHLRTPVSSLVFLPGERGLCFLTRSIFPSCSPDHLAHLLHTMSCSATSPMSSFFSSNIFNPLALTVSSFYLQSHPGPLTPIHATLSYCHLMYSYLPTPLTKEVFPSKETLILAIFILSLLNISDLPFFPITTLILASETSS